jgi:tRNA modification GTPase
MMHFRLDDTIGALASAAGAAGRGVIRLSGPAALAHVETVFEQVDGDRLSSGQTASARAGVLRLEGLRAPVPVLLYVWPHRRSYTGQRVVEIHAPGSPPLLEAILANLFECGIRPAAAGEFTLRAFLAGRIDLVQAEAVLGVIDAADSAHLTTALRQLAGGISEPIVTLRAGLMDLLADLEAGLDFVEEDIQFVSRDEIVRRISATDLEAERLLTQCESRMQSAGRARIVLAGLPNAGKSTLFNALMGREAALVSQTAGTTRDYLRGDLDWQGLAVELSDTAGWEGEQHQDGLGYTKTENGISEAAQALAEQQWGQADLIVWCSACDLEPAERRAEAQVLERLRRHGRSLFVVHTKGDLESASRPMGLTISAISGAGLAELVAECVGRLAGVGGGPSAIIASTAARCRECLSHCRQSLSRARLAAESRMGDELLALEIRDAVEDLGRILGAVYTDDILDRIFSRFCIGK